MTREGLCNYCYNAIVRMSALGWKGTPLPSPPHPLTHTLPPFWLCYQLWRGRVSAQCFYLVFQEKLLDRLDDVTTKTETISYLPENIKSMSTRIEVSHTEVSHNHVLAVRNTKNHTGNVLKLR